MAHRIIRISLVALVALTACGGDDKDWPNTAPTSRFDPDTKTNVDIDDNEIAVMQNGLDALDEMDGDLAQQTYDMVVNAAFNEDWTEVCDVLDAAAQTIETDGVLAVDSNAWHATTAILGESVRNNGFDTMRSQCETEFDRAINAQNDALNL